jgi:DNA-binding response OmpR family regulator
VEDAPARPRILVADDELGTLALMAEILTYGGFDVTRARDGLEALVRALETRPDLALIDVMMPGLDGREVCRRMRADPSLAATPIILHSSADSDDVDWREVGADAFLQKPFSVRELPSFVRGHLGRRGEPPTPPAASA